MKKIKYCHGVSLSGETYLMESDTLHIVKAWEYDTPLTEIVKSAQELGYKYKNIKKAKR